jgi:hypothetical protein
MPYDQPATQTANADGFFEAGAFFLALPASEGRWHIGWHFETQDGRAGSGTFEFEVSESIWLQRIEQEGETYFVSWVAPGRPVTGENPFEVALHRETATGFLPVTDAVLDLYPYMDMGGGDGHSTPYEPPVHTGGGHYEGRVNFIMSGGWDMTVYVDRPEHTTATVVFENYSVY